MKFIFSLNLKGLFKEKKEKKKKSQIEDYLSSIKIQMHSYSFFETLFYYFFVVIKFVYVLILIITETALQHSTLFQRKFSIFFVFSCWEDCEEGKSNLQVPNYQLQISIYLFTGKQNFLGR